MGTVASPVAYIEQVPDDKKIYFQKLRKTILEHLPKGFEECISYGMIGYVVPHKLYPPGYHCDPKLPLPFVSIAAQKKLFRFISYGLICESGIARLVR